MSIPKPRTSGEQSIPELPLDAERRIRRAMRLRPRAWGTKRKNQPTILSRITLVAGAALLGGWTGSALWHR